MLPRSFYYIYLYTQRFHSDNKMKTLIIISILTYVLSAAAAQVGGNMQLIIGTILNMYQIAWNLKDLLKTCYRLAKDLLETCYQLACQLSTNLLPYQLPTNLLTTCWQFVWLSTNPLPLHTSMGSKCLLFLKLPLPTTDIYALYHLRFMDQDI